MKQLSYALKYRPKRFQDVYGQDHPVRFLSGLIQRGQRGRNILLHGTVGSGKTTLARLYGRALNCRTPDDKGSPCNVCSVCAVTDVDRYDSYEEIDLYKKIGFFEYDVPRYGGAAKNVNHFLERAYHSPQDGQNWRILFFDEAHLLLKDGSALLLKLVEEPKTNVIFCFATTEPNRLLPALRSRLFLLEVRPLPPETAKQLLEIYAAKENIEYEPEALALLAGLKHGYPRDLLTGLEQVIDPASKERLTVELVRQVFDVDQTLVLVDYFLALARGEIDRQIDIIASWREPRGEIIRLIQAFLTAIYYINILKNSATVDALMRSISDRERAPILDCFCKRLQAARWTDLRPFWREMLTFWQISDAGLTDTAAMLRITLFQDLVKDATKVSEAVAFNTTNSVRSTWHPVLPVEPGQTPPTSTATCDFADIINYNKAADPSFLRLEDVRAIINAASFLTQENGVTFNVRFDLEPAVFGATHDDDAMHLIKAFCEELEGEVTLLSGKSFALIALRERTQSTISALVLAHISRGSPDVANVDCLSHIMDWCRKWRSNQRLNRVGEAIPLNIAPMDSKGALEFHWRETINLCAGVDASLCWESATSPKQPLTASLKIRSNRASGRVKPPIISVSGCLHPTAVGWACRYGMDPLSAFDMRAWSHLRTGWERDEHIDRVETRQKRELDVEKLVEDFGVDSPRYSAELHNLEQLWETTPEHRGRFWRVFWQEGEG